MRLISCFMLVLAVAVTGCKKKDTPPPTPQDMPTTKQDITNELRPILDPLRAAVQKGKADPDYSMPLPDREETMSKVREIQRKYGDKDFAQEAFKDLGQEMKGLAQQAAGNTNWANVAACIDLFELLDLDSPRMEFLDDRAEENLGRPKVFVKGFIEDKERKDIFVLFETVDRRTGKVELHQLREGEETEDLRVVKVIGNFMAVRFEYLKIPGLFFDVKAP